MFEIGRCFPQIAGISAENATIFKPPIRRNFRIVIEKQVYRQYFSTDANNSVDYSLIVVDFSIDK